MAIFNSYVSLPETYGCHIQRMTAQEERGRVCAHPTAGVQEEKSTESHGQDYGYKLYIYIYTYIYIYIYMYHIISIETMTTR